MLHEVLTPTWWSSVFRNRANWAQSRLAPRVPSNLHTLWLSFRTGLSFTR